MHEVTFCPGCGFRFIRPIEVQREKSKYHELILKRWECPYCGILLIDQIAWLLSTVDSVVITGTFEV